MVQFFSSRFQFIILMKSGRMPSNIELMYVTKSFPFEAGPVILHRRMWDSEHVFTQRNKGLVFGLSVWMSFTDISNMVSTNAVGFYYVILSWDYVNVICQCYLVLWVISFKLPSPILSFILQGVCTHLCIIKIPYL